MHSKVESFCQYLIGQKNAAYHTVRCYKADLIEFQKEIQKDWGQITRLEIFDYLNKHPGKPKTKSRKFTSIRVFYTWLQETTGALNPTDNLRSPYAPNPTPNPLTAEEIEALFKSVTDLRDKLLISLLFHCGLKVDEVCQLTILHDQGDYLTIPKHNKRPAHQVAITPSVRELIDAYLPTRQTQRFNLLVTPNGSPLSQQLVSKLLINYGSKIGIQINPSRLRHSFAALKAQQGESVYQIQQQLGLKQASSAAKYLPHASSLREFLGENE